MPALVTAGACKAVGEDACLSLSKGRIRGVCERLSRHTLAGCGVVVTLAVELADAGPDYCRRPNDQCVYTYDSGNLLHWAYALGVAIRHAVELPSPCSPIFECSTASSHKINFDSRPSSKSAHTDTGARRSTSSGKVACIDSVHRFIVLIKMQQENSCRQHIAQG